jgi:hypothetical protein
VFSGTKGLLDTPCHALVRTGGVIALDWNQIAEIIKGLAWPVTVLSLAWILRHEVRAVIGRMESAKLPGGAEISFGRASIDNLQERRSAAVTSPATTLGEWTKTGNTYWLGHDIMWTIDVILRNAPGSTILYGLRQSVHHLNQLELADSSSGIQLKRLYEKAKNVLESEWTAELRNQYSVDLRRISDQIGALAESQQQDFKAR